MNNPSTRYTSLEKKAYSSTESLRSIDYYTDHKIEQKYKTNPNKPTVQSSLIQVVIQKTVFRIFRELFFRLVP